MRNASSPSAVVLVTALAMALAAGAARPARAEGGLAGALYGDVKDVIEEVIRAELAASVARTVRQKSPALAFYFASSLERLESPYWGNLGATLREDLVGLAGDLVFWVVGASENARAVAGAEAEAAGVADVLPPDVKSFFLCLAGRPVLDQERCARLTAAVVNQRETFVDLACVRRTPEDGRARFACDLALATRAALRGRAPVALRHVIDAVAHVVLLDVEDASLAGSLHELLLEWLGDPAGFPAEQARLLASAWPGAEWLDAATLEARCADADALLAFIERPEAPAWVCFAVATHGLPAALEVVVTVERGGGGGAGGKIVEKLQYFRVERVLARVIAAAEDPGATARPADDPFYEALAGEARSEWCARAGADPVCGGALGPATITVTWLGRSFQATLDARGAWKADKPLAMARAMRGFHAALARVDELRRAVPAPLAKLLFPRDKGDVRRATVALRGWLRVMRFAGELRARWYLWPLSIELPAEQRLAELDLAGLLEVALGVYGEGGVPTRGSFGNLGAKLGEAGAGRLARLFAMAFGGRHRELAVECLRLGLDLRADGPPRPEEAFFVALVAYLLDDPGSATGDVTRAAFRAAARDLLASAGQVGVPAAGAGPSWSWWPRLALRGAFAATYVGAEGRAGYRQAAAIEWPNAMWAFEKHVGVELSLVDFAAPLAELALRPVADGAMAVTYEDEALVALDLVRPRLGLWLALPELTPRLALSAGIAWRLVGVSSQTSGTMTTSTYVRRDALVIDLGVEWVF